jgi:hypothetical protein
MAGDGPHSKAEMMERVHARWDELQDLLLRLGRAEFEQPLADGWSAKVHVGHIAAWERSLMALLRADDRSVAMGVDADVYRNGGFEAANAVMAARVQSLPLDEVAADSQRVHVEVMALLESMTEADLAKPYSHYQPNDPPYNPKPVFGWVNGNTWGHYEEHIAWLKAGLKS